MKLREPSNREEKEIVPSPIAAPEGDSVSYFSTVVRREIKPTGLSSLEVNLLVVEILDAAHRSVESGIGKILNKFNVGLPAVCVCMTIVRAERKSDIRELRVFFAEVIIWIGSFWIKPLASSKLLVLQMWRAEVQTRITAFFITRSCLGLVVTLAD